MNTNTNLTVAGVDLGSSSVKIAAVLKGGVQIITNEANFRQTPNLAGLGQKQRLIGQAGQLKIKSNHSNTVSAPSRFLGFDQPCPYLQEQLKFCPAKALKMQDKNSKLAFNLLYGQERQPFTPEQLVASYLTEIQKIISHTNNLSNRNLVIAVPPYFTQHERKALMDAVQICKKKLNDQYATQFVNEQIAISIDYGYSKRNQFSEDLQKPHRVLFIDFGHSKANLFVTAFNKQHMRVLANKFDRQLGCKFLDQEILNFYANRFDLAHPNMQLNLLQSKKAILKLLDNIEKQRKVLSGNTEHDLNIQCLLEDQDLYYSMKRDQYQEICKPVIQKFRNLMASFLEQLKLKGITFDTIELVGGGTRIPAIIKVIIQVFGQEPYRTINSSECIAKGAALVSAMNSTIFKVQPYSFFTISPYTVEVYLNGLKVNKNLIDKNELLLKEKSIEIEVENFVPNFKLLAQYNDQNLQKGLDKRLFECEVEIVPKSNSKIQKQEMNDESEQNKTYKLSIEVSFDQSGQIRLENIKSTNKQLNVRTTKVNYFEKFTQADLRVMEQKEKQMTINDFKIKKFYEKKNEFESFIYKSNHALESILSSNPEYISQTRTKQIKSLIQGQENWLNSGLQTNSSFDVQEFEKRKKVLNQKIEEIQITVQSLKQGHLIMNTQLQKLANLLNDIISKRSQNEYPEEVNRVGEWTNEVFEKQKSSPKCEPPVVSPDQIKQVYHDLVAKIHQFDQQIERQRQINMRRTRQAQQRHPQGGLYRPAESSYHPQGTYGVRQHEEDYLRPRTNRNNRNGYNSGSNPFGSFFGKGFF